MPPFKEAIEIFERQLVVLFKELLEVLREEIDFTR